MKIPYLGRPYEPLYFSVFEFLEFPKSWMSAEKYHRTVHNEWPVAVVIDTNLHQQMLNNNFYTPGSS